jgi:hypothetical protein
MNEPDPESLNRNRRAAIIVGNIIIVITTTSILWTLLRN